MAKSQKTNNSGSITTTPQGSKQRLTLINFLCQEIDTAYGRDDFHVFLYASEVAFDNDYPLTALFQAAMLESFCQSDVSYICDVLEQAEENVSHTSEYMFPLIKGGLVHKSKEYASFVLSQLMRRFEMTPVYAGVEVEFRHITVNTIRRNYQVLHTIPIRPIGRQVRYFPVSATACARLEKVLWELISTDVFSFGSGLVHDFSMHKVGAAKGVFQCFRNLLDGCFRVISIVHPLEYDFITSKITNNEQ